MRKFIVLIVLTLFISSIQAKDWKETNKHYHFKSAYVYSQTFAFNFKMHFQIKGDKELKIDFSNPENHDYFGIHIFKAKASLAIGAPHFPMKPVAYKANQDAENSFEVILKEKSDIEISISVNGQEILNTNVKKANFPKSTIWISLPSTDLTALKNFQAATIAKTTKDSKIRYNLEHYKALKKGSKHWNTWRNKNRINLRGANFSGLDLSKADLSKADLRDANLSGAKLTKANLQNANLQDANLSKANLTGVVADNANFKGANLSKANLHNGFFYGANFSKANLNQMNAVHATLTRADFSYANLEKSSLYMSHCQGVKVEGANFKRVNTFYCTLVGVDFGDLKKLIKSGTKKVRLE